MRNRAFTLVELLTVITIIGILASLILMTSGFVQKKAATSRANAEIQAMSSACESYKADNGIYPRNSDTDALDSSTSYDPANYKAASLYLYGELSGDRTPYDRAVDTGAKSYMEFKPTMLAPAGGTVTPVTNIQDPFGFSYGYSTAFVKWQEAGATGTQKGYNPTFDLWSTAGTNSAKASATKAKWIKNW